MSVTSEMAPEQAWALASDLNRFDEWLTIFGGWRSTKRGLSERPSSDVPPTIEVGTRVSSCIKVKGFRNTIHWEVTQYDAPTCIHLTGHGRGGVHICLTLTIAGDHNGSTFNLDANLYGGVLSGPIGKLVARVLKSDVHRSVANLSRLSATAPGLRASGSSAAPSG